MTETLQQCVEEKELQYGKTQLSHWNRKCQGTRVSDLWMPRFWTEKQGQALRDFINKLSDQRNLRDPHMKHYYMSTKQFRKKTTHLDFPGKVCDVYQHVVKTCPFCNSVKPRPERSRSRVSGLRAEEFGHFIFLDHGSAKIGDKTFGFLIVLD